MKKLDFIYPIFITLILCGCTNNSASSEKIESKTDSTIVENIDKCEGMQSVETTSNKGVSNTKPTDLLLFELKGDVASVRYFYTANVTPSGKREEDSQIYEGGSLNFNKEGELTHYDDVKPIIQRESGNIVEMEIPNAFGGDVYTYTWSKEGLPKREDCVPGEGLDSYTLFNFNRHGYCSLDSKTVIFRVDETEEEQTEWTYNERIWDSHGNWLVRVATETANRYTSYTLEERLITYYNTLEDNEWLYGTWKCRIPVGYVVLYVQKDGQMYSNMDRQLHVFAINKDRLTTFCNGDVMSYDIDWKNKRIECYDGLWFEKY